MSFDKLATVSSPVAISAVRPPINKDHQTTSLGSHKQPDQRPPPLQTPLATFDLYQQQQQQQQQQFINDTQYDLQDIFPVNWAPGDYDTSSAGTAESSLFDNFILTDDVFLQNGGTFLMETLPQDVFLTGNPDLVQGSQFAPSATTTSLSSSLKRCVSEPSPLDTIQPTDAKRICNIPAGYVPQPEMAIPTSLVCSAGACVRFRVRQFHLKRHVTIISLSDDAPLCLPQEIPPNPTYHTSQIHSLLHSLSTSSETSNSSVTRREINSYILTLSTATHDPECTVTFCVPKIGQKSYGNEKRFFCPPPMACFSLSDPTADSSNFLTQYTLTVSPDPSGSHGNQQCGGSPSIALETSGTALVRKSLSGKVRHPSSGVLFKQMYIGDVSRLNDQRAKIPLKNPILAKLFRDTLISRSKKNFGLFLNLTKNCPKQSINHVGTFTSETLTMISKPTKKKTVHTPNRSSRKGKEERLPYDVETIPHGSLVSLYNRLKSQTVSTKYFTIDTTNISRPRPVAKNTSWQPLIIRYSNNEVLQPAKIVYNSEVYLECSESGWISEPMIIRKIDTKASVVVEPYSNSRRRDEESVLQLQKVAFQRVANHPQYLEIDPETNEVSFVFASKMKYVLKLETDSDDSSIESPETVIADRVSENAIWSIVCVSRTVSTFYCPSDPSGESLSVTPVPHLASCQFLDYNMGSEDFHLLDLDIYVQAHGLLEVLDELCSRRNSSPESTIEELDFDLYLGNILCESIKSTSNFVTENGRTLSTKEWTGTKSLDDSLSVYRFRKLCKLPSWNSCLKKGWDKNAPILFSVENPSFDSQPGGDDWTSSILEQAFLAEENIQTPDADGFPHVLCKITADSKSNNTQHKVAVPLLLVRKVDGIIYRSRFAVSYSNN